jgi:hypothetical protein
MTHITPAHMVGFNDELSKEAGRFSEGLRGLGRFARSARDFAGSRSGRSAAFLSKELKGQYGKQIKGGLALGALGGAAVADPEEGWRGRLGGAVRGGLVGGGLAGARVLATKEGRGAAAKGLGNFYKRQKYSLTGKGLGSTPQEKLEKAREIGLVERFDPSKFSKTTSQGWRDAAAAAANAKVQEEAFKKGYMSAPGVVEGLLTRPGDVIKSGWERGGLMGKAFAGLGAYSTVKGLAEKPEPGGPGRLQRGLAGAGSALGWMVAPTTLLGGQIIGGGGSYIGSKIGRLGDRAVSAARGPGRVQQAQYTQQPYTQQPYTQQGGY